MNWHVLVDFDGTITERDVTDMLLSRFALPEWLQIEEEWRAGRIGSRECMARQVDLLRVTPSDYDSAVDEMRVDPGFARFVDLCRSRGMEITIVSDGLDRSIGRVLDRASLELPFYSNRLEHIGGDRWRLGFPHARSGCRMLSGNCKCQFAEGARTTTVMIGDGRSDFCVAARSDLVLAKGALAEHCRREGLPHVPIRSFADASARLKDMLEGSRLAEQFSRA